MLSRDPAYSVDYLGTRNATVYDEIYIHTPRRVIRNSKKHNT